MGCKLFSIKQGGCFAAAALAVSPALAQDDDLTLAPSSDWVMRKQADKCRLSRTFGTGEDETSLYLDQASAGTPYNLSLIGRPFRSPYGERMGVQFGPVEQTSARSYIKAATTKGRASIAMFGVTLAPPAETTAEPFDASLGADQLSPARRSEIAWLRISRSLIKPVRLETGMMGEPLQRLDDCAKAVGDQVAFNARLHQPTLLNGVDLGRLISFPGYYVLRGQESTVRFRLTVDTNGKPTFCSITESTRPQVLDDLACLGLLRHARFAPAIGPERQPIVSMFSSAIRFEIR